MSEPEKHVNLPEPEDETVGGSTAESTGPEEAVEPEPWTPERVSEWNAYYDVYVVLGVLLLVFFASANKITNASIWPQLQLGRLIIDRGAPVTTDPFSYTQDGKPWVNIPWLFEVSHAFLYKTVADFLPADPNDPSASTAWTDQVAAGSLVGLTALARVLTALALLSIRRAGPGRWWSAVCVGLAVGASLGPGALSLGGLAGTAPVSPMTWGLLFLALELLLLHRAIVLDRAGSSWLLVVLFALWANFDESFLIGLILLAAATVGRIRPASSEAAAAFGFPRALMTLVLCALACLANPAIHRVYAAAAEPFLTFNAALGDIVTTDQLSLFGEGLERVGTGTRRVLIAYYAVVVLIGLVSFVLNQRRFSLTRFLVYVTSAALWALYLRFGVEFSAVWCVTLALNGQEWYQDQFGTRGKLGLNWTLWSVGGRVVTIVLTFMCIATAILGGLPVAGFNRLYSEGQFGFGYDPDDFSFEGADYLKSAPISGNVLNTSRTQGDALIWRASPLRKTYFDSREHLFTRDDFDRMRTIRKALSEDDVESWRPLLDELKVSVVLLEPIRSPATYTTLMKSTNWIPFHDDGSLVMFGRADGPEGDVAFFNENRLDPEMLAYKKTKPAASSDQLPTPVNWMDKFYLTRSLTRPQSHDSSAERWLFGGAADLAGSVLPEPARCLLAIREARSALAAKPNDPHAYRLLSVAYRDLMVQETALMGGLKLTPENATRVALINPQPTLLMTRFRQRATALNFAIQTTPPPTTPEARHELQRLNLELFELYRSANFLDLAEERLKSILENSQPTDFTPEGRTQLSQQLAQFREANEKIEEGINDLLVEQQASPIRLAGFALGQGAPAHAMHELEEAERTGTNPALVKPQLLEIYCDTGQPDKAVMLLTSGDIRDPNFGVEPGISPMRQGRVYFLLGNTEYAATLWEKYAIPALRADRSNRALFSTQRLVRGEVQPATSTLLEIPDKVTLQASWEFEAGLCRLEGGTPELASEHFVKALQIAPKLNVRPVIEYYLEKMGQPIPGADGSLPEAEAKADTPKAEEKPSQEATKADTPKAEEKPREEPVK